MTTKVAPLGLRLFMEGVEVPVISAQVSVQPDRPATAAIQVVPSEMGLHFLPRTLVHLFYLDPNADLPSPNERPRQTEDAELGTPLNRFDALDSQYKLMYVGEVIGFNYGKTPSSRQLVLQCMDLSSYWDTCYQWFADYSVGGGGLTDKSQNFIGAGTGQFNSISGGHQWVIGRLINSKPKSSAYQGAEGLLGGILHLLEAIGGIRYKSNGEPGFRGVNDFFTVAELRYNLLGMIGAVEKDETSAKIYANKAFRSWLRNGMTSLGSLLSFRDIINHVMKLIFHNIYPNPCAQFVAESTREVTRRGVIESTVYTDDKLLGAVVESVISTASTQAQVATSFFATASEVEFSENRASEDDDPLAVIRIETDTMNYIQGLNVLPPLKRTIKDAISKIELIKTDDRRAVLSELKDALSNTEEAIRTGGPASGAIPDLRRKANSLNDLMSVTTSILSGLLGIRQRSRRNTKKTVDVAKGAHLFNQLLLPELFFVAPPRCNVVFPDQYTQFSFSRNFMREVSRLMCRGGVGMIAGGRRGSKLLGRHYFAPAIRDAEGKLLFATADRGARVLLPHEVHSGIIPKFEWVTDGHRFASKAAKETGTQDKFTQAGKVGYIQRLANFQFYLHRFSARTISVSGVFNPNIVIGFPGLVIDRSMPAPIVAKKLKEIFGRRWLPQQYLGKMETFAHSISQSGGQTTFTMSKCRTHRGLDDEFLGTLIRETPKLKSNEVEIKFLVKKELKRLSAGFSQSGATKDSQSVADLKIQLLRDYLNGKLHVGNIIKTRGRFSGAKILSISPSGNFILSDQEADALSVEPNTTVSISRLEEVGSTVNDEGQRLPLLVEVDTNKTAVSSPEKFVITVKVSVNTGVINTAKRTVEEALTPGWYSEVWKNENIGKDVYKPLLGEEHGAITDEVTLGAQEQDKLLDQLFEEEIREGGTTALGISESRAENDFAKETTSFASVEGGEAIVSVAPGSIEESIDALVLIYSLIRRRGGDVHQFIRDYTHRDIASIEDILGSKELFFDDNGNIDPSLGPDVREGFHSRAFGDYNTDVKFPTREGDPTQAGKDALHALYPGVAKGVSVTQKSVLDRGEPPTAILPELDPRGRARARVLAYVEELSISRGLVG